MASQNGVADDATTSSLALLPALAVALADAFPEFQGRAIAVSEWDITKDNIPTLPLIMLGLLKETSQQPRRSNQDIQITESVIVQFLIKPEKYRRADGSESPFWAFYDYEALRNKLLAFLNEWRSPRKERLLYRSLDIEADQLAVVLSFQLEHIFEWCADQHLDASQHNCGTFQTRATVRPI